MSHFFAFQCNVALSKMWINGAIRIICLKSAKLLSFAVNSDHSSDTDPNLEALVQHHGCKVYLIYRRRPSVSLCQFERCNVAWDGVSVMKSLNQLFCCFESKINSFCWHFVSKLFSMDNRTTIIHMAGGKGRFAEIQGSSWNSFSADARRSLPPLCLSSPLLANWSGIQIHRMGWLSCHFAALRHNEQPTKVGARNKFDRLVIQINNIGVIESSQRRPIIDTSLKVTKLIVLPPSHPLSRYFFNNASKKTEARGGGGWLFCCFWPPAPPTPVWQTHLRSLCQS